MIIAVMLPCSEQRQAVGSTPQVYGKAAKLELLWQELFSDTSHWWDNRLTKKTPKHPDFKHKTKLESLWIDCQWNPPWVKEKLATLNSNNIQPTGVWRYSNSSCKAGWIKKLCQEGRLKEALHVMKDVVQQNAEAPLEAYVCLLKSCARRKALAEGKQVHALIIQTKCVSNIFLENNLVNMYAKCGNLSDAHKVFNTMSRRNVVSWTAIISAYVDSGKCTEAIDLFQKMQNAGIEPDKFTFAVILKACARIAGLEQGKQLHCLMLKCGLELDVFVENTIVNMYAKCGCLEDARKVFNEMIERDVVSWNVMIDGYAQVGLGTEALALYEQMKQENVQPNQFTLAVVLKACASIAALDQGKHIHSLVIKRGFQSDVIIQSALVEMYCKSGRIEDARRIFNNMSERDMVSWTGMIAGYAYNGLGKEALLLHDQMIREGVQPNQVTYICVLSACSHSGLVEEGRRVFNYMIEHSGVTPTSEHYCCMVDLLCRAGCLAEAEIFINSMPIQPTSVVWMSLLGAAKNHRNLEIGRRAFNSIVELEPEGTSPYLLLIDICAAVGRMDEVAEIRNKMKDKDGKQGQLHCG